MGRTRVALTKEEKREIGEYLLSKDPSHTQAEARRVFSKKFNRPLPNSVIHRISKRPDKFQGKEKQKYRTRDAYFPEFEEYLFKEQKGYGRRGRITKTLVLVFANKLKKRMDGAQTKSC